LTDVHQLSVNSGITFLPQVFRCMQLQKIRQKVKRFHKYFGEIGKLASLWQRYGQQFGCLFLTTRVVVTVREIENSS